MYLADVVHADVPLKAWSTEGVSQPTGRVVTLEHQDPLAACLGEQGSDGQAPDARAHDDGVEGRLVGEPLVAIDHTSSRARCVPHKCEHGPPQR